MRAACESSFAAAAYWPRTNIFGTKRSPASDANQSPLASPSAAESQLSSTIGAEAGAAACVDSISP